MKKITLIVGAFLLSFGFLNVTPTASAATCNNIVITNTGANSINNGTCTVNTRVVATCLNNVYVLDANTQSAVSGQASVVGTVNAGSAISGAATNSNGSAVTIGAACGQTTGTTTPTTPTTPGTGSTTPPATVPTAAPKQAVKALPYTAGNDTLTIVIASVVAAIAAFAVTRFAAATYRRAQLNK